MTTTNRQGQGHIADGWASLRHRSFRIVWAATFISNAGSWMQKIATAWLIYRLTGSEAWLGIDAFASGFTTVMLLPVGGVIADRIDRRKLLILTNLISAVLALSLAVVAGWGVLHVWHIVTVSALSGMVQAAMVPASTSLLPALVDEADVPNAIALNSLQFNLSRIAGPVVGGLTLVYLGAAWSFALNAFSFIVLVGALFAIRIIPRVPHESVPVARSLLDGVRFVRSRVDLVLLLSLVAAGALFGAPVITLLPALVKNVFGRDAGSYSILVSCFGVGAVGAAMAFAAFGSRLSGSGSPATLALALVGLCQIGIPFGGWRSAVVLVTAAGFGFVGAMIYLGTRILQTTADAYRGRVTSLQQIFFRAGQPLGSLIGGFIGQAWGLTAVFCGFGAAVLIVAGAHLTLPLMSYRVTYMHKRRS